MDIGKSHYFLGINSHSEIEERGVKFVKDKTFYRKESTHGRDLAVLSASLLKDERGRLRVLDLMCGSGIRSTRYLTQSKADFVWANDNYSEAHSTIMKNLTGMDDNFPAPERMGALNGMVSNFCSLVVEKCIACLSKLLKRKGMSKRLK